MRTAMEETTQGTTKVMMMMMKKRLERNVKNHAGLLQFPAQIQTKGSEPDPWGIRE